MQSRHDDLRDELVAVLGAGRELPADTDRQLADAFVHFLEQREAPERRDDHATETLHQPHYSLQIVGAFWGAALMFLFLLAVLDNPDPVDFIVVSVVLLALVGCLSRAFLFLARYGWQMPRLTVTLPERKARRRG